MALQATDLEKIRIFLEQYKLVLKNRGTQSDSYTIDVIDDILGRLI